MQFFFPGAACEEEAENLFEATRKFAEETMAWSVGARRVRRLAYIHDGFEYIAEVGGPERRRALPRGRRGGGRSAEAAGSYQRLGEEVVAILEAPVNRCYLVCKPNRGFVRGMPIMVGFAEVSEHEDFDDGSMSTGGPVPAE